MFYCLIAYERIAFCVEVQLIPNDEHKALNGIFERRLSRSYFAYWCGRISIRNLFGHYLEIFICGRYFVHERFGSRDMLTFAAKRDVMDLDRRLALVDC